MITVHKYPLEYTEQQDIELPAGAALLTVQVQHNTPVLWARVDTTQLTVKRRIHLVGTGHPAPTGRYLSTIQLHGGTLVLHAFEG